MESEPSRPQAYLLTSKYDLLVIPFGGHTTAILEHPKLKAIIPWAERAVTAVELHCLMGPDPLKQADSYAHRTEVTTPLDTAIFDAFYAFGGHRLVCYQPWSETQVAWELTGPEPQKYKDAVTTWLKAEEPFLEGTPRLTENFTLRLCPTTVHPSHFEYPAFLKAVEDLHVLKQSTT